jgi:hypothetical protein
MRWPQSKSIQAVIAFAVATISAILVAANIAMESFNHYYFAPHRAFPYPYPTDWAARLAMCRDCGLTFLVVFAIVYVVQRWLTAAQRAGISS